MRANQRHGYARLFNGTVLGFLLMLGLLALATSMVFAVRSDLDLALNDAALVDQEIALHVDAKSTAEAQVAALKQQQVVLQQQTDAARVAQGAAEEAAQREGALRMAAEQQSASDAAAKLEADRQAEQERQARAQAETAAQTAAEEAQAAQEETVRERLEKQLAERNLATARTQARRDVAREQAQGRLLLLGIVNGGLTYAIDDIPGYAAEGVANALQRVGRSLRAWNEYGFSIRPAQPREEPDFTIGWLRDAGGHLDTPVGEARRILVPLGETNCQGDWAPYDDETVLRLLWHELGHALGYGHSSNPANIMYPALETKFSRGQTVDLVVTATVPHIIPLCGSGLYTFVLDEPGLGYAYRFDVLRPNVDTADIYHDVSQYQGCGSATDLYTNQCMVEDGAALLVYTYNATTRISGTITKNHELPGVNMDWDPTTFRYSQGEIEALRDLFR